MKRILALLSSFIFVIACGDDSSSAFDALSENLSSSSAWIASSSSNSRNDVNSSSSVAASSSSTEPSSSSSAKKLSGEVSGDPLQIFKTRVPKKAVYHCDLTQETGGFEGDFDQKDWICSFKYAGMEGYDYVLYSSTW